MSQIKTLNGVQYTLPQLNDTNWGANTGNVLTQYIAAIADCTLQLTGGAFTLTADADFGGNFGLKALYLKSETANIATAGVLRLASTDTVSWRNNANSANVSLGLDGSDNLKFTALLGGKLLRSSSSSMVESQVTADGSGNLGAITSLASNSANPASAGLLRLSSTDVINWRNNANSGNVSLSKDTSDNLQWNATKVLLSGAVVNADINASAAIAYSKLALTGSIVNADVSASAAIAYSKLSLTGSVVNADIASGAAIAYSKLNLSGSVVNADIGASAAIAVSKLAALTVSRDVRADSSGFLAVKPLAVQATTTTAATVTSSTFTNTNLSATITPSNANARIKITVSGDLKAANVSLANACLTIARGSTNLASTNGFATFGRTSTATGSFASTVAVVFIDSPATASAVTYNVQIRSDDNTTQAAFPSVTTGVITLEEIS